jgi:hypothetical protein
MNKEFVMRGKTASGGTEVLNFSGFTPGYAYRLTEFSIYPATQVGTASHELLATVTAAKTGSTPTAPNFNDEGLIGVCQYRSNASTNYQFTPSAGIIDDTFLITQDLILSTTDASTNDFPINWQCRFIAEKLNNGEEAVTNFRQFNISSD